MNASPAVTRGPPHDAVNLGSTRGFTLSDNDALFIAEAILLQRKEPGVVLPEHRSEKHGVIRLASRQAEPRLFSAGPVPLTCAAADTRNDQLTDC